MPASVAFRPVLSDFSVPACGGVPGLGTAAACHPPACSSVARVSACVCADARVYGQQNTKGSCAAVCGLAVCKDARAASLSREAKKKNAIFKAKQRLFSAHSSQQDGHRHPRAPSWEPLARLAAGQKAGGRLGADPVAEPRLLAVETPRLCPQKPHRGRGWQRGRTASPGRCSESKSCREP